MAKLITMTTIVEIIYCSFNDTLNISAYIAAKDKMNKKFERGRGLIWSALSLAIFLEGTLKAEKTSLKVTVSKSRSEPRKNHEC
jgi:uncharacterized membrane protein